MPLLGTKKFDYEVTLKSGKDVFTEYVIANDNEHAAWAALELSTNRNCQLINVRRSDEW